MNWKALLKTIAVGAAGGAIGATSDALKPTGIDPMPVIAAVVAIVALLLKNPWGKPAPAPPPEPK